MEITKHFQKRLRVVLIPTPSCWPISRHLQDQRTSLTARLPGRAVNSPLKAPQAICSYVGSDWSEHVADCLATLLPWFWMGSKSITGGSTAHIPQHRTPYFSPNPDISGQTILWLMRSYEHTLLQKITYKITLNGQESNIRYLGHHSPHKNTVSKISEIVGVKLECVYFLLFTCIIMYL